MIWGRWYRGWMEPGTAKVLGVRLRPYTVGHEIVLSWMRSPLVEGGRVLPGDLMTAAYICSHADAEAAAKTIFNTSTKFLFLAWAYAKRRSIVADEVKAFTEYRDRARWFPSTYTKANPDPGQFKIGAPLEFVIVRTLCSRYNYTPEQVLKMPFQRASLLHFADLDCKGDIHSFSESDFSKIEKA